MIYVNKLPDTLHYPLSGWPRPNILSSPLSGRTSPHTAFCHATHESEKMEWRSMYYILHHSILPPYVWFLVLLICPCSHISFCSVFAIHLHCMIELSSSINFFSHSLPSVTPFTNLFIRLDKQTVIPH